MESTIFLDDLLKLYLQNSQNFSPPPNCIVDIIVPIYNGYEFLVPMLASMEHTKVNYHLFLINDCSPDPRISPYLQSYAKEHANATVIENDSNKGYIKSVNLGFSHSKHHVVVLNTDIMLPENWLERLIYPILSDSKIASVTPYSNAGYLCSFPLAGEDNPLLNGLDYQEIDRHFSSITPNYPCLPTGVGFCMALNHNVLTEIGFYNEEEYINAYAEENDWCQHAIRAGYKNVLADNLFVYHKHHGSYNQKDVSSFRTHNAQVLQMKFPSFFSDVAFYLAEQPNNRLINLLILLCLCNDTRNPTCLLLGAPPQSNTGEIQADNLKKYIKSDASTLLLTYNGTHYRLDFFSPDYHFEYALHTLCTLGTLCKILSVMEIEINDPSICPDINAILN
ncbi:MAG: glycosyltransferase family 2 protein [Lachnospiraceae bacterium]|nr:glycosyltransferase family 2 protein [Lachnospiraceae bacterium]